MISLAGEDVGVEKKEERSMTTHFIVYINLSSYVDCHFISH